MALTPPPATPVPAAPAAPGDAPSRANPTSFRTLADAFVVWLVGFRTSIAGLRTWLADYMPWAATHVTELNALQADVTAKQSTASTAASTATTKAGEAAASASSALASKSAIDNRSYPGTYASDPTTRPDGTAIAAGDEYFNSASNLKKRYNGATWVASDINTANLAASTGASLVGYKGATVLGARELDARRPRKLYSKLFALASATTALRLIPIGDSLGAQKVLQLSAALDRKMGGPNTRGANAANSLAGAGSNAAGVDVNIGTLVSAAAEAAQYTYWFTGDIWRIDAAGSVACTVGGVNPTFTDVDVFYFTEPGAGTLGITVGGSAVASVSANAAAGLAVLTYTKADAAATLSLTATGGSVRFAFAHVRRSTVSGVDRYDSFNKSGLLLSTALASAQAVTNLQSALVAIAPDVTTFEMDDDFGTGTADQAAFLSLVGALDAACPNADKIIIASTPRASNDAGKLASSYWLRGQAAGKDASYLFFDSYALLGTYAQMGAIFGADDGTHPAGGVQAYAADVLWHFLGLNSPNLGYIPRAVNDPGTASKLASGTTFGDSGKSPPLVFVDSNGFQGFWRTDFSYGVSKKDGTCKFQISYSGSWPSILPLSVDFDSSGNVRKMDTSTSTGLEFTRFRKTDNPGGGLMHLQTGLLRSSFTRSELLAIAANNVIGAAAYCSDCTGGAQWVYARGGSGTDWVTIDGKAAI